MSAWLDPTVGKCLAPIADLNTNLSFSDGNGFEIVPQSGCGHRARNPERMRALVLDAAGPEQPEKHCTRPRSTNSKPQNRKKQLASTANSFAPLTADNDDSDPDDLDNDDNDDDELPGLEPNSDSEADSDDNNEDGFEIISNSEVRPLIFSDIFTSIDYLFPTACRESSEQDYPPM